MEKFKYSMQEIGAVTGESPNVVYDAIRAGHLETFLVGRRRFARHAAIQKWIDFLERESRAGRPVSYRARARVEASAA